MSTPREICSDCGSATHEIRVIDRGDLNRQYEHVYALAENKRSRWTGNYPIEGAVIAFMCEACGRITHYAVPKE